MSIISWNLFIKQGDTYRLHSFGGFIFDYQIKEACRRRKSSAYEMIVDIEEHKPDAVGLLEKEVRRIANASSCHKEDEGKQNHHKFAGDTSFMADTETKTLYEWDREDKDWKVFDVR